MYSLQLFISQQSKRLGKYSKTCVHNEGQLYQRQAIRPGKWAIVLCWTSSRGTKLENYVEWWKNFDSTDSLNSWLDSIILYLGFDILDRYLKVFKKVLDGHGQVNGLPPKSWGTLWGTSWGTLTVCDFTKTKRKCSWWDNRFLSTPFVVCNSLFPTHLITLIISLLDFFAFF